MPMDLCGAVGQGSCGAFFNLHFPIRGVAMTDQCSNRYFFVILKNLGQDNRLPVRKEEWAGFGGEIKMRTSRLGNPNEETL